jgi:hypothetical protein
MLLRCWRLDAVSVSAAAGADVPAVSAPLQELHLDQHVEELAARGVVQLPEASSLFAPEVESGHLFVLSTNPIQGLLPRACMVVRLHRSSSEQQQPAAIV